MLLECRGSVRDLHRCKSGSEHLRFAVLRYRQAVLQLVDHPQREYLVTVNSLPGLA